MTRFLYWRKMTWVVVAWSVGMLGWLVARVAAAPDAASECARIAGSALTRRECLDAAGLGTAGSVLLVTAFWLAGTLALGVVWFMTRPLWRQGHGGRLRRLRPDDMPWLYAESPLEKPRTQA